MSERIGIILSRADVDAIQALYEMGCSCGVITPDDSARWDEAQKRIPELLAALHQLGTPHPVTLPDHRAP
jgi:hypothetical protein